jgi:hypothetical protein
MTRQEEIVKGFNESWSQFGINVSSNVSNPINGITVNNPNGGRAVALNFIDGVNATKLTAAQIAALPNPQAGQIVYQTDGVTGVYVYDGASWAKVGGLSSVNGTTNRITVTGGNTIDIASTYVGQTSITTLGTITTGTWTGIIGQATMTLGSDATGDIYYRNSGGNLTRLGIGSAGQVLGVSAGIPAWQAAGSGITVGTTTITSGTSGRIAFNNSGVYGESADLFFDLTNKRLGIGTSSPSYFVDVISPGNQSTQARFRNTTTQTSVEIYSGSGVVIVGGYASLGSTIMAEMYIQSNTVYFTKSTGARMFTLNDGYMALGTNTSPTARIHLPAGTASAGTAPLKLTAGTNLTTPESGAFEFDGTNLYFTVGGVRKTVTLV